MLLKSGSDAAKAAMDRLACPAPAAKTSELVKPSPEAAEITALKQQIARLEAELHNLRADWSGELQQAETRAKDAAVREHVRNDEARLAAVRTALDAARSSFAEHLQDSCMPLARSLAAKAFTRLAAIRQEEEDWLARLIERRIAELGEGAVVSLLVSEADFSVSQCQTLQATLPVGASVARDGQLAHGTARLVLTLGAIDIDGRRGTDQLADLLEADIAHG